MTQNLVRDTPVDIGWAKANWVPSLGRPYTVDLSDAEPETDLASANAIRETGEAEVLSFSLKASGSVYITNNVPYIGKLNEGHSKQAPVGYVQQTIEKSVRSL